MCRWFSMPRWNHAYVSWSLFRWRTLCPNRMRGRSSGNVGRVGNFHPVVWRRLHVLSHVWRTADRFGPRMHWRIHFDKLYVGEPTSDTIILRGFPVLWIFGRPYARAIEVSFGDNLRAEGAGRVFSRTSLSKVFWLAGAFFWCFYRFHKPDFSHNDSIYIVHAIPLIFTWRSAIVIGLKMCEHTSHYPDVAQTSLSFWWRYV